LFDPTHTIGPVECSEYISVITRFFEKTFRFSMFLLSIILIVTNTNYDTEAGYMKNTR